MRILRSKYLAAPALLIVAGLAGCGSGKPDSGARDGSLTIYTSLPRAGLSARRADAVAAGERLALADAGGRAGGRRVRLVELDSSAPGADTWDPGTVDANARRAVDDRSAIAYIGELDLGASAISVPVTNADGLLQVSPADGLTTLTRRDPDALAEGPERYYPLRTRTFLRLVPADYLQAEALVAWAKQNGARSIAILRDDRLYGRELAEEVGGAAARAHLPVTVVTEARHGQPDYSDVARDIANRPAGAVIYTGLGGPSADRSLTAVHAVAPKATIYGSSGLAAGGVNVPGVAVRAVDPGLPPERYGRQAQRVLDRLRSQRGAPTGVESLYGYEAMQVVLAAMNAARGDSDERAAVVRAAMRPERLPGPLRAYSLTRTGDVVPAVFGAYRRAGGRVEFLRLRGPGLPATGGR